jgi:NDP-sugar pyrophosphorylase family protein
MRFPRKAMVLAAGLGTRLRPLTEAQPKALIQVGGRPMIEYPLRMLAAAGVEEVVINLHHLGDLVFAALGDGGRFGLCLRYSREDQLLDTGGAVVRARTLLGDEPFVLANCDALLDPDLAAAWAFHRERKALATLLVRRDAQAERYGALDLDADGRVRRFLGRPASSSAGLERWMFGGVHLISPEIFDRMPAAGVFSITRDVYLPLVESGEKVFGWDYAGYWGDVGSIDGLSRARADVDAGRFSPGYLRPRPC